MLVAERVGLAIAVQGLEGLTKDRGCYSPVFKRSGDRDCMAWSLSRGTRRNASM